jgi:hypothetical protein
MILSYIQNFLMTVCDNKHDFYVYMSIVLTFIDSLLREPGASEFVEGARCFCHQA